jgi:hypothetical protein
MHPEPAIWGTVARRLHAIRVRRFDWGRRLSARSAILLTYDSLLEARASGLA